MLENSLNMGFISSFFVYELTCFNIVSFRHPNINELSFVGITDIGAVFNGTYIWQFLVWVHAIWNKWYVLEGVEKNIQILRKNDLKIFCGNFFSNLLFVISSVFGTPSSFLLSSGKKSRLKQIELVCSNSKNIFFSSSFGLFPLTHFF